jgi:hypothetical protein
MRLYPIVAVVLICTVPFLVKQSYDAKKNDTRH